MPRNFALLALSPLDGRYYSKLAVLRDLFSEFALIKARLTVEIRWLQSLANHPDIAEIPALPTTLTQALEALIQDFSLDQARAIKDIEETTNHDVKAIEYFLKEFILKTNPDYPAIEFIHFGITSEDVNNLAYGLLLKNARPYLLKGFALPLLQRLRELAETCRTLPMLARTHGQAASPTTLGKEFANHYERLVTAFTQVDAVPLSAKCNGAVGNFNALNLAYPDIDWIALSKELILSLGLTPLLFTTQIEPHDYLAKLCHAISRANTILLDFNRDCWHYISLNYFSQQKKDEEVGSSTMPHKINPIDFENSEGNLGLANALLQHFAEKLPVSRFQRDLSDSTVLRNLGIAFGYSLLAYQASLTGLNKITINQPALEADLASHTEVLAEAVQTLMRRYGIEGAYEKLKSLTRGQGIDEASLKAFINTLNLPTEAKQTLLALRVADYTGLAAQLVAQHLSPLPHFEAMG